MKSVKRIFPSTESFNRRIVDLFGGIDAIDKRNFERHPHEEGRFNLPLSYWMGTFLETLEVFHVKTLNLPLRIPVLRERGPSYVAISHMTEDEIRCFNESGLGDHSAEKGCFGRFRFKAGDYNTYTLLIFIVRYQGMTNFAILVAILDENPPNIIGRSGDTYIRNQFPEDEPVADAIIGALGGKDTVLEMIKHVETVKMDKGMIESLKGDGAGTLRANPWMGAALQSFKEGPYADQGYRISAFGASIIPSDLTSRSAFDQFRQEMPGFPWIKDSEIYLLMIAIDDKSQDQVVIVSVGSSMVSPEGTSFLAGGITQPILYVTELK